MPVVLITGGTGLVGKTLTRQLLSKGYDVIILSRKVVTTTPRQNLSYALWNIKEQKIDGHAISKADFIIHLAGAGVMDKNWTENYKKEIIESRTKSSELLIKGLSQNIHHVKAIISASAIGWYGENKNGDPFSESDEADEGFLGQTCKLWEQSIAPASSMEIRLVKLRLGIVLSNDGGALPEFERSLKFGIAAILGSGTQVISWIHIDDVCRLFMFAMENEHLHGSYNAVAPYPVTNKNLMLMLAKCLNKYYIRVHVPSFALKLLLGEKSIEVLKSANVSSGKISASGFTFLYPAIEKALEELSRDRPS